MYKMGNFLFIQWKSLRIFSSSKERGDLFIVICHYHFLSLNTLKSNQSPVESKCSPRIQCSLVFPRILCGALGVAPASRLGEVQGGEEQCDLSITVLFATKILKTICAIWHSHKKEEGWSTWTAHYMTDN